MLNRHNLEIAKLCSKESSRHALNSVRVTPEYTESCNGHSLMRVSLPAFVEADSYPTLREGIEPIKEFTPFLIGQAAALEIAKAIKPKGKYPLPCQSLAAITNETENNGHAVIAVCSDLENPREFRPRKEAGQWPQTDLVIPQQETAQFAVALDLRLLIPLLKQLESVIDDSRCAVAEFYFKDHHSAVRIDAKNAETGQSAIGAIMPINSPTVKAFNVAQRLKGGEQS